LGEIYFDKYWRKHFSERIKLAGISAVTGEYLDCSLCVVQYSLCLTIDNIGLSYNTEDQSLNLLQQ
jgi:hypothetical protein